PDLPPPPPPPPPPPLPPPPCEEDLGAALAWDCFWTGLPVFRFAAAAASALLLAASAAFFLALCAASFFALSMASFLARSAADSAALAALSTISAARFATLNALMASMVRLTALITAGIFPSLAQGMASTAMLTQDHMSPPKQAMASLM